MKSGILTNSDILTLQSHKFLTKQAHSKIIMITLFSYLGWLLGSCCTCECRSSKDACHCWRGHTGKACPVGKVALAECTDPPVLRSVRQTLWQSQNTGRLCCMSDLHIAHKNTAILIQKRERKRLQVRIHLDGQLVKQHRRCPRQINPCTKFIWYLTILR